MGSDRASIKIAGQPWTIIFHHKRDIKHPDGDKVLGWCDLPKQVIHVAAAMAKRRFPHVCHHELTHAVGAVMDEVDADIRGMAHAALSDVLAARKARKRKE